jgi:hypothetical protein
MSRVNMARATYISQLHKFNNFMQNGLFGRDRLCILFFWRKVMGLADIFRTAIPDFHCE